MIIEGAIFDLDGTLLDSMHIWRNAASKYLRHQGKIPEEDVDFKFSSMSFAESSEYISKKYLPDKTQKDIMDEINAMVEDFYFNYAETKNGVPALLEEMAVRGVKMSIATATDKYLVEAALKRNNIRNYFCRIVTSNEVGSGKDNPAIYEAALKALNVDKGKTVVFEDLLLGLKTAKTAGFMVAGIYDRFSEDKQSEIKAISNWYITDYNVWVNDMLLKG